MLDRKVLYDSAAAGAGLADHWVDLVLAALLSIAGYLADSRLRSIEERCKQLEDQLEATRTGLSATNERVVKVETICQHPWTQ